jgi:DNA-binding MarR family transcriptional regulator
MPGEHDHDRPLQREPQDEDLPLVLPHRSDVLASVGAMVSIWMSPRFQRDLAALVEPDPDVPALLLLRHLGFRGPQRPATLSEELGMTRSNVSKIVQRLESAGLVARLDHPDDQRGVTVALTAEGEVKSRRAFEVGDRMADAVLADWSEEEVAAFVARVQRFAEGVRVFAAQLARGEVPPD